MQAPGISGSGADPPPAWVGLLQAGTRTTKLGRGHLPAGIELSTPPKFYMG